MMTTTERDRPRDEIRETRVSRAWHMVRAGGRTALLLLVAGGLFAAGVAVGSRGGTSPTMSQSARDFMFEVTDVKTSNQGGQALNLFFHYRYADGIAEQDIPDYRKLRNDALDYLATTDLSRNPYWETLNHHICAQLKTSYPLDAISCQLQVVGKEAPGQEVPGYRASIETLGDITPLSISGPPATPS